MPPDWINGACRGSGNNHSAGEERAEAMRLVKILRNPESTASRKFFLQVFYKTNSLIALSFTAKKGRKIALAALDSNSAVGRCNVQAKFDSAKFQFTSLLR